MPPIHMFHPPGCKPLYIQAILSSKFFLWTFLKKGTKRTNRSAMHTSNPEMAGEKRALITEEDTSSALLQMVFSRFRIPDNKSAAVYCPLQTLQTAFS
ncbi:MAG: hypothetical protein ACLRTT_16340 [Lachnospiraceae bacterium]